MAIRTIDAPGIEMHEIDKSQYSPAMTGTKVLVTGFANSGEDYIPMIFTSKSAWLNYYGEPDNEAERYFYTASMEVLNQNGVVNCCKLPYENEARDKFVGFKYKINTGFAPEKIKTVDEALDSELSGIKAVLPNSEVFRRDVLNFFLASCNVTDAVDKLTVLEAAQSEDPDLAVLSGQVNLVERSDEKTPEVGDDFYKVYADGQFDDASGLSSAFLKTVTKGQLKGYVDDLGTQTAQGVIPKLNAYYFIKNTELEDGGVHQDISVVMESAADGSYAILTAENEAALTSDFLVETLDNLVVWNPNELSDDQDEVFATFTSNQADLLKYDPASMQGLTLRSVNGIDALQLVVDGSNADSPKTETYNFILDVIKARAFDLQQGTELEDAVEYFDEVKVIPAAIVDGIKGTIDTVLAWSEIRKADDSIDKYWKIESSGSPALYDMSVVDEYRTDESRVATNQILVVDKTRKSYGKVPEDANHKNDGRELIGIIPVITTAANALQAQAMIDVAKEDIVSYEPIKNVQTLDTEYNYLGAHYHSHNTMEEGQLSTVAVISQRFNNEHTPDDNADDFFDSVALAANSYFPSISLNADGGFDRENMKKIGLVVFKAFLDASEGNRISFQAIESFVGSLDRDAKNPNTGATTFIDTIVNEQSEYVNIFTNCMPTDALKKLYREEVDIFVIPHDKADVASMGFYEGMCEEDIDVSESILKALDLCYEKVTDINERELDIVVDAGISNIAQFVKTVYGNKGFYDPSSPNAAMWKCVKDNDVKMWKTIIQKMDNFCKNVRKDCMFIADGPRPYCLQGQKKIVRPSKPTNTIDANILPFTKYLTGINTSYSAGYCDWFQVADEFSGDYFWCPPSIKACGVYIYTDLNFEYWDAPAGLNRGMVAALDVAFSPTIKQAGQIYTKNWNYAVNYPQEGIILEGQKTLQQIPSSLDRVNVRRALLRLERAVYKVLRYVIYEGHTAALRQRVVDLIKPYFEEAKIGGGLTDYRIICDESINTPEIIDRNELKINIGLKFTKTIEFIGVNFILLPTGASWEEML